MAHETARHWPAAGPCPSCGKLTVKETAEKRQWWDQWPGVFIPMGLCALTILQIDIVHLYGYWLAVAGILALFLLALFAFRRIEQAYPIGSPLIGPTTDGNHAKGEVRLPNRRLAYVLLNIAALTSLLQPLVRLMASLPLNDHCSPPLLAPGDSVKIYIDSSLQSLNGSWGGEAQVTVLNASEFDPPLTVECTTEGRKHADVILERRDRNQSHVVKAFIVVFLPDRSDLVGRTVRLAIDMQIELPRRISFSDEFRYESEALHGEQDLRVATPTEAAIDSWGGGLWGPVTGIGLYIAAVAWLFWTNRRIGQFDRPPKVFVEGLEE